MKKRFLSILLALSVLCAFIPITASAGSYNGLTYDYNFDDQTIRITRGDTTGDVVIPSEIEGWTVTAIADGAFSNCYDLTSVTIPDTVTSIGKNNFGYAPVVVDENNKYYSSADGVLYNKDKTTLIKYPKASEETSFTVPDSVITISEEAFWWSSLKSVTIPDSVTTIGDGAFRCCYDLTDVNIGSGVTAIGTAAFGECKTLNITFDEANQYFCVEDGVLYNKDKTILLQYLNGMLGLESYDNNKRKSFTIPDGVEIIADSAFYGCTALKNSVTIPDSVKTICDNAFYDCMNLSYVNIGSGVTYIGENAFYSCHDMNDITIPDGVTYIGDYAFYRCYKFDSITIPDSVTRIGKGAFESSGLKAITLPDTALSIGAYAFEETRYETNSDNFTDDYLYIGNHLIKGPNGNIREDTKTIADRAFYKNESIESVVISDSVEIIGDEAFYECSNLKSVALGKNLEKIGDNAFYYCKKLESVTTGDNITYIGDYAFYYCSLNEFIIPEGVTYIGVDAFYGNDFTDINIPNGVIEISDGAFHGCSYLVSVTISDSVTKIGFGAFKGCWNLEDFSVGENNTDYSSADGVLYNKDKTELIQYPSGNTKTEFTIPDTVTNISKFYLGESLTALTIPNSVKYIGDDAFESSWRYGLTDVYFIGTETQWNRIEIGDGNEELTKATMHFVPILKTTAEITKSESDSAYTFEVDAEEKYEDCYVYVAVYDENGALVEINCVPMDTTENTNISVNKNDNGKKIKIFIWTDTLQSIIDSAKQYDI